MLSFAGIEHLSRRSPVLVHRAERISSSLTGISACESSAPWGCSQALLHHKSVCVCHCSIPFYLILP
jgi:hypothetical protein